MNKKLTRSLDFTVCTRECKANCYRKLTKEEQEWLKNNQNRQSYAGFDNCKDYKGEKMTYDWNYIIEHKCLCWFWDNKYKFRVLGLLTKYDKNKTCPFSYKHLTLNTYFGNYKNCKPAKKFKLNFYEDKENE